MFMNTERGRMNEEAHRGNDRLIELAARGKYFGTKPMCGLTVAGTQPEALCDTGCGVTAENESQSSLLHLQARYCHARVIW
jgi:hypothetical protein